MIRTLSSMYLSFIIIFRIYKFPCDRIRISMQFILIIGATVCKIRFIFFVCFGESFQFEFAARARACFVKFYNWSISVRHTVCFCPWKLDVTVYSLSVFTFDYYKLRSTEWKSKRRAVIGCKCRDMNGGQWLRTLSLSSQCRLVHSIHRLLIAYT